jgi:methionyl-tRNA formyltransferase
MNLNNNKRDAHSFAFFGTSHFSVLVLDALERKGFVPTVVITQPDKPKGRNLILTAPEVKIWADARKIRTLQYSTLKNPETVSAIEKENCAFFVVASYGKIIPKTILDVPKYGTLNVHPSLLPKYRGASPIQSAILSGDTKTGVTIILLDELMDHGPILAQKIADFSQWPVRYEEAETVLAHTGADMLAEIIPQLPTDTITKTTQNESEATFCKKIEKEDGKVDISNDSPELIYRKLLAFAVWPGVYFETPRNGKMIRIIIKKYSYSDNILKIETVLPEGKKEMKYEDFLRGQKN